MVPLSFFDGTHSTRLLMIPSALLFVMGRSVILAVFYPRRSWLFFSAIQAQSHITLARLRAKPQSKDSRVTHKTKRSGSYFIPTAGCFSYVSCPHYLGEILIYIAFVCANLESVSLWFVICNGLMNRHFAKLLLT